MGKITGFLELQRIQEVAQPANERVRHYREFVLALKDDEAAAQGARCMDCGIPFCQSGCPVHNVIPDWNDLVYRHQWQRALEVLHSTNNFPEFTGRVCPAPCEAACVLGINSDPVTIKQIEWEIVRRGWDEGWVRPIRPEQRTGRSVAVVGSGPSGLAAAQQLNRAGHTVTVFEKADRAGGLLRYGIPDFKLEKWIVERRVEQMRAEGVLFQTGVHVGADLSVSELRRGFDAILLAMGSEKPRDLPIPGRELGGVHFAMEFLPQQNRRCAGDAIEPAGEILATGKHVVVLGGGDTGSDCVGTSHRHGARSVTSLELLERPPDHRHPSTPWPLWPLMFRSSSSHDEGGRRDFGVMTKRFSGSGGRVEKLHAVRVRWSAPDAQGRSAPEEIPGSDFELPADLVLLAMGFVHPVHDGLLQSLGVRLDPRGNVAASPKDYATSEPGVFAAGDVRRGQSLVVWAISEGREAARAIDRYLVGDSHLPARSAYV